MCEALVCVKDMNSTGNLAVDSRAPKQGDVVLVVPDGYAWGNGELGGPTWDKQLFDTYAQDISITMLDGFDATLVNSQAMLYKYMSYVVASNVADPASLEMGSWLNTAPLVLLANDDGLPAHFSEFVVNGQVVTFTRYSRIVSGTQIVPIAQHPLGNHNFWRVVKFPNVTVAQASKMMVPEPDVDPAKPSPYLQFRLWYFDKTKIPAGLLQTYWNDDTRAQGFITLPYTAAQMNNIVSQRTPIPF